MTARTHDTFNRTAAMAYAEHLTNARETLRLIATQLDAEEAEFIADGGTHWGMVGDIAYVSDKLGEALDHLVPADHSDAADLIADIQFADPRR